ncbi:hypothetical protein [Anaeromicropila populeti]|uniref:Uncharacterized protein n=1 Tax=Anaeromicropila populeti TaxID=37658 RepID=A0A1I6IMS3_9FIRM|nr:hypothetical protein [Anaeromicropila populeti]SFR67929.1 hypothetical protein SAMN05661086_00906 [Anaeromicropila populeti]
MEWMNREQEIMEKGIPIMEPRFKKNMEQAGKYQELHANEVMTGFLESFDKVFRWGIDLQKKDEKGKIDKIAVFFLRSSIRTKSYDVYIQIYDSNFYMDKQEVCGVWKPKFIMQYYDEDILFFERNISSEVIRVEKGELRNFEMRLASDYMKMVLVFLGLHLTELFQLTSFDELEKTDSFQVIFGELYGAYEVLFDAGEANGQAEGEI